MKERRRETAGRRERQPLMKRQPKQLKQKLPRTGDRSYPFVLPQDRFDHVVIVGSSLCAAAAAVIVVLIVVLFVDGRVAMV